MYNFVHNVHRTFVVQSYNTDTKIHQVTSNTNNVEIIQAQLNKLTVTSVYKLPNEQFSFGSNLASTQMNVVIGDFNSHGVKGDTEVQTKTAD